MSRSTFIVLAGLFAGGVGLGAGTAATLLALSGIQADPNKPSVSDSSLSSPTSTAEQVDFDPRLSCEADALAAISVSLKQVGRLGKVANNPLPTVANLSTNLTPDLFARLNPAPWPQISDRARLAAVPIIMYHDITAVKDVSYDVLPEELEAHFQAIEDEGLTPISMDQLYQHLQTGVSLPAKPIVLTFDDNYLGQYEHAFPLLKEYGYPALFSVHTDFVGKMAGKPKSDWYQLKEMLDSGLVTIASHSASHRNFSELSEAEIRQELTTSKQVLEENLGIKVRYFTYPEGTYNESATELVAEAGYEAALTMSLDPYLETVANESKDLLTVMRYGQSRLYEVLKYANGGPYAEDKEIVPNVAVPLPVDYTQPVEKRLVTVDNLPLTLVFGGKPVTVHADSRYAVEEIMEETNAIAAVDGTFFSLEYLDSNTMIGPILSQNSNLAGRFLPGNRGENPLLRGRPLVLISPETVKFVPYDPDQHTSLSAIEAELSNVTDAFVGAAWLVRDGEPQSAESFGDLYGADAFRDRAFWGIDRVGRPVIGVSMEMIDSVGLGKILAEAGLQEVVMLDSGASAALAYRGKSVMAYTPRPVPHIVALLPPEAPQVSEAEQSAEHVCPATFDVATRSSQASDR
jgi:biofilm PGA synthesis lipoprotein PgaB